MNAGEARPGQLVQDGLSIEDLPRASRPEGSLQRRRGAQDRTGWEARHEVDGTDGRRPDRPLSVDGAPVAPPSLPPAHPVLGATLRPPLAAQVAPLPGHGIGTDPAGGTASGYPTPPAPAADRFVAPDGYPPASAPYPAPSPYQDGPGRHAVPAAYAPPPVPAFAIPAPSPEIDPQERELWFHPRVEQPPRPASEPAGPAAGDPPDPSTVAIPLSYLAPSGRDGDPSVAGHPLGRPAGHAAPPAYPGAAHPGAAYPGPALRPTPRDAPPMSRRARRAAETVEPPVVPAPGPVPADDELPDLVDGDDWFELPEYARPASATVLEPAPPAARGHETAPPVGALPVATPQFPAPPVLGPAPDPAAPVLAPPPVLGPPPVPAAPPVGLPPAPPLAPPAPIASAPPISPSPIVPVPPPSIGLFPGLATPTAAPEQAAPSADDAARPRAGVHRTDPAGNGPTTSSIPVIRPPVQVRRPDDDPASATAETRSLRVTPPEAKALFRTPVAPKGGEGTRPDGWAIPSAPSPAVNATPPTPAPAPPPPAAPKPQLLLEDDAETGELRRAVVLGGRPAGSASWTPVVSASPGAPPAAPSQPADARPQPAQARPAARPPLGGPDMPSIDVPATPSNPAAASDWLDDLRDDEDADPRPWRTDFGTDQAPVAATIVPARGREARQNRKAAAKALRAEEKAAVKALKAGEKAAAKRLKAEEKAAAKADRDRGRDRAPDREELPVGPVFSAHDGFPDVDDLDDVERGRWLSLLVFWAPALILLLLAGVVIWLVR